MMKYLQLLCALAALASGFGCSETRKYRDDRYWTERVAGDIKLQAPVDIFRSREMEKQAAKDGPSTAVIYTSPPDEVFRVVVSRIDFGSEIELDIDRIIAGGDHAMGASIGDSSAIVTSSPCEWRGLVCRRGSFTGKKKGRPFRVLSLHLLRDRTLWSVSVGYSDEADRGYAERVLTSVVLDPAR
jgi:hypothetical protein